MFEKPLPLHVLCGLDTAIKRLRPHAGFTLSNGEIIQWDDPTGSEPPTKEEINQQLTKDFATYNAYIDSNSHV